MQFLASLGGLLLPGTAQGGSVHVDLSEACQTEGQASVRVR